MLKIIKEYKFQLGGSVFHASEGDSVKVRLKNGEIIIGILDAVNIELENFILDTEDSMTDSTIVNCEDVADIMPM